MSSLAVLSWTGLGCLLWAFMAQPQERLLEMRRQEERLHPAKMAEMRQQNELILKALKDAAETTENVARKSPWSSR
ncbi:PREDICTED: ubiquinol-cytochrome-c reductase complex assembly factor 3-like [Nanorana parkeri]|uniref:ubiquinol-cytochrome-c reductase complex assembly factor 3-like n=1 Tax=Nanorana parkeri TaxID=125878 RepID=UPI00085446C7|nr:PREDICTED: ubiquinol-cytochrome-c reductase complex assembly factor 3-like [Nanorana parkeri]